MPIKGKFKALESDGSSSSGVQIENNMDIEGENEDEENELGNELGDGDDMDVDGEVMSEGEGEGSESELDEDELDDELQLPPELRDISLVDKRYLYKYMQDHNEFDYEEEIVKRIDALSKKRDMERLKQLAKSSKKGKIQESSSSSEEEEEE
jgi:hypothetical protein